MNAKFIFNFRQLILLIGLLFLGANAELFAQDNISTPLKGFEIVIEKTDEGIMMEGVEGTTWGDLSFTLNNYRPLAIDQNGMAELEKISTDKDIDPSGLLFTIVKTEKGIALKGLQGTAWKDLEFSLNENEKQGFNQFGMADRN